MELGIKDGVTYILSSIILSIATFSFWYFAMTIHSSNVMVYGWLQRFDRPSFIIFAFPNDSIVTTLIDKELCLQSKMYFYQYFNKFDVSNNRN